MVCRDCSHTIVSFQNVKSFLNSTNFYLLFVFVALKWIFNATIIKFPLQMIIRDLAIDFLELMYMQTFIGHMVFTSTVVAQKSWVFLFNAEKITHNISFQNQKYPSAQ